MDYLKSNVPNIINFSGHFCPDYSLRQYQKHRSAGTFPQDPLTRWYLSIHKAQKMVHIHCLTLSFYYYSLLYISILYFNEYK